MLQGVVDGVMRAELGVEIAQNSNANRVTHLAILIEEFGACAGAGEEAGAVAGSGMGGFGLRAD